METRVEIYKDGLWHKLRLQDGKAIKYNALINRIGKVESREISHTNTFTLPHVHQNTVALGINTFNKKELAKALNSKYPAKYYVQDKLLQQGFLVINNTNDGQIQVNFIDEALELTDKWGSTTFNELIISTEVAKPSDYVSAIAEMTDYDMNKSGILTPLTNVGSRGYNLAIYPNALNTIGDKFQISHVDDGEDGTTEVRLNNSFNPYQSRPIWNMQSLFDLACESYGYTPYYDPSINWANVQKTFMVDKGLEKNQKEDDSTLIESFPPNSSNYHYVQTSLGFVYTEFVFHFASVAPENFTSPDLLQNTGYVWTNPPGFNTGIGYVFKPCVFIPNVSQATLGTLRYRGGFTPSSPLDIDIGIYSIWGNATPGGNMLFQEMTKEDEVYTTFDFDVTVQKSELASGPAGSNGVLLGVIANITRKDWDIYGAGQPVGFMTNLYVTETYLPENVVSYDEFDQYIANNISLTHSAPRETIKDLLTSAMQKEGILMSITRVGGVKTVKFFSYGSYEDRKDADEFEDWSKYLQRYDEPLFNTDYGNNYAKLNDIGLSEPYVGNTYKYELENQQEDSKYKDFAKNHVAKFKDIQGISNIENDTTPYFEYKHLGLGIVETTDPALGTLAQIRADGVTQGDFSGLQNVANVNYAQLPDGVQQWYKLIDEAVRVEATFLLPVDIIRNLDLSRPIFVEGLGGYFIIEEIAEYVNAQTKVQVKLIKLIDNLSDTVDIPGSITNMAGSQNWSSEYTATLEKLIPGLDMEGTMAWSSEYTATLEKLIQAAEMEGSQSWSSTYSATLEKSNVVKEMEGSQAWSSSYSATLSKLQKVSLNLQEVTDFGWTTSNILESRTDADIYSQLKPDGSILLNDGALNSSTWNAGSAYMQHFFGSAFYTRLQFPTASQDNIATLQDGSGTLAFLSDVTAQSLQAVTDVGNETTNNLISTRFGAAVIARFTSSQNDFAYLSYTGDYGGINGDDEIIQKATSHRTDVKIGTYTAQFVYPTWSAARTITWPNKSGEVVVGTQINNTAYAPSWNGVTTLAPTMNAVYDKIESLGGGAVDQVTGTSPISVSPTTGNVVVSHLSTAGNKHIPTGGSSNQYLKYNASGTAVWASAVYSVGTSGAISGGTITGSGTITHLTTAGYKHIPTGGSVGQILKNTSSGTATWQNETGGATPTLDQVLAAGNESNEDINLFGAFDIELRIKRTDTGVYGWYQSETLGFSNVAATIVSQLSPTNLEIRDTSGANDIKVNLFDDQLRFTNNGYNFRIKPPAAIDGSHVATFINKGGDIAPIGYIAPSSSTDTGVKGEMRITTDYLYICRATNTWERIATDGTF